MLDFFTALWWKTPSSVFVEERNGWRWGPIGRGLSNLFMDRLGAPSGRLLWSLPCAPDHSLFTLFPGKSCTHRFSSSLITVQCYPYYRLWIFHSRSVWNHVNVEQIKRAGERLSLCIASLDWEPWPCTNRTSQTNQESKSIAKCS